MSVRQKPDGHWFVKWYEDGKQKWKYFGRGEDTKQKRLQKILTWALVNSNERLLMRK